MKTIRRTDLIELLEDSSEQVVSLYMPLQTGAESRQNAVRLKNLLRAAEEKLVRRGLRSSEAQQLLEPARDLFEGQGGEPLRQGLAMMASPNGVHVWQLPIACDERCEVGSNFFVLPLVAALGDDASYYVLAASQNEVRLLQGTRSEMEEESVPGLPANRAAALGLDEPEPAMQAHVGRAQVPGKGDLMYHGHGGAPDAAKDELELFLRYVDRAVAKYLQPQSDPLVFAGVDYLFPIYQRINSYPHLLPTPIIGNPELWSPVEIRERAWPLIEPLLESRRNSGLAKYGNLIVEDRSLDRMEDILFAAQAGAVDILFADLSEERRGRFDPEMSAVRIDESPQDDSEDLINLAAVLVLRSSGAVEPLSRGNVPGGGLLAAVLRYPFHAAVQSAASPSRS